MSLPGGQHYPHQKACRLQCCVATGQTIDREETQHHSSTDRWIKVLLSMALIARGTRPSSIHHHSLPLGSLHKTLRQAYPPEGRQKEELQSCRLWNRNHNHRNIEKMKWQRNMSQRKEQDKTPEKQLSEVEIGILLEKQFRIMIMKMIQDLRKRMEAKIEKMQEMFNKDLEELKNKQR